MILLIPVDEKNYDNAKIALLEEKKAWISIEMDAGFVKKYTFFENRNDIKEFIDFVIVKNKSENIEEFLDEGIDVLVAPMQRYVEDIVDAYKFRELHEI